MKKRGLIILLLVLSLFLINDRQVQASTKNEYKMAVAVEDSLIEDSSNHSFVSQSTTYIPIREFTKSIRGSFIIGENTNRIVLRKGHKWLKLYVKERKVETSDGTFQFLNLFVRDNRTYAPIRFLGEFFEYEVQYLSQGPVVRLTSDRAEMNTIEFLDKHKTAIQSYYKNSNKPLVYLTFDDGPTKDITSILNVLKQKNAKATFFMLEPEMRRYPNEVKRLVKEGHYPALHSVSHDRKKLYYGNSMNVALEMERTRLTLLKITGVDSRLTRVPYGSKPFMKDAFRNGLASYGFKMWDWNIDTFDWKYQHTNPNQIFQNVKNGVQKFKGGKSPIVILMHVNKGTAQVLPQIIEYLYAQGYECAAYNPNKHFMMNFWKDPRL